MNWNNVRLILEREIRDQLRDRRTLFMIAVLPLVLYPLLGMSFFQVTQFVREHAASVLVIDAPHDAALPPLVADGRFDAHLFESPSSARLLNVTEEKAAGEEQPPSAKLDEARQRMLAGNFDLVVVFPEDFANRYARLHAALVERKESEPTPSDIPAIVVYQNQAKDASKTAQRRVEDVLNHWRAEIVQQGLVDSKLPVAAARPFGIETQDVAEAGQRKAAVWSKILPFILLIWALTGAFYPAVDLCAGEKERGTLETLLSSPAERIEIVWGKLLTIMLFSMATAVLNLLSLAITGSFVLSQLPLADLGPPSIWAVVWLLVALGPVSALFSALCLALAAFARSTKEGQYYLMPLVLITMPLVILPMSPGVELNLGNSLIPLAGVVLLLRGLLEGEYLAVLPYVPIVVGVTLACCWMAIRWATNQFNAESVLFRESERWDVSLWIKHLRRDRGDTPSFAEAMFCGILILMIRFFMSVALPAPGGAQDFLVLVCVTQLVVVLTPALLMTVMLTRSPRRTLLLHKPPLLAALAAVALAVVMHPSVNLLQSVVMKIYPLSDELAEVLKRTEADLTSSFWPMLLAVAVLPAVCEELAFRGFILSGLRHLGRKWTAIVLSSIFFAAAHTIFQQSLVACLVGMVIGYIAVQTGSLWPGMLFHAVHNSTGLIVRSWLPEAIDDQHPFAWMLNGAADGPLYRWPVILVSMAGTLAILAWFHRMPYVHTREERLQEAIEHQSAHWLPG